MLSNQFHFIHSLYTNRVIPLALKYRARFAKVPLANSLTHQRWLENNYRLLQAPEAANKATAEFHFLFHLSSQITETHIPHIRQFFQSLNSQQYTNTACTIILPATLSGKVHILVENEAEKISNCTISYVANDSAIWDAYQNIAANVSETFLILCRPIDVLAPHLLSTLNSLDTQETDLIYTDHDHISEESILHQPFFKPAWNPEFILSKYYLGQLLVVRRKKFIAAGGLRGTYRELYLWDFVLRITQHEISVSHIATILFHERVTSQHNYLISNLRNNATAHQLIKDTYDTAGHTVVAETVTGHPSLIVTRTQMAQTPQVRIIIPFKDKVEYLQNCIDSLFSLTNYPHFQVTLVNNGSKQSETASWLRKITNQLPLQLIYRDDPFNYAKLNNLAVSQSNEPVLIFLNSDTVIADANWISKLLEYGLREQIGPVGPKLLYPNGEVQSAGAVFGLQGFVGEAFKFFAGGENAYHGALHVPFTRSAITGACMLCRRSVFESVGGFDEALAIDFNDIDFCLKANQIGYRSVCVAETTIFHYESLTRGAVFSPTQRSHRRKAEIYMREKWGSKIDQDPFYNPHLSLSNGGYVPSSENKTSTVHIRTIQLRNNAMHPLHNNTDSESYLRYKVG